MQLVISFVWQLTDLYFERIFKRKIPNWFIGTIETLGFIAFFTLFVEAQVSIYDILHNNGYYNDNEVAVLLAYDSVPWAISL